MKRSRSHCDPWDDPKYGVYFEAEQQIYARPDCSAHGGNEAPF
ncbi:MAG: hypothetical protein VX519_02900 [Myxococcota bacterium]|nr:hypothetical protein [Myxococcota bacterium]